MSYYLRCTDCKTITPEGKLSREYVKGTGMLRGYCECGNDKFEEPHRVCTECEKHEAVKDDDLCKLCLDAEKDALADIELTAIEDRSKHRDEFRDALIDILVKPWRKQA